MQYGLSAQGQPARLVAGLWGTPDASREQTLRSAILDAAGPQLAEIGFDDVAFEWTLAERRQYAQLGEGELALLEVDPGVYFQARRYWLRTDPQRWQYEAIFQRWDPVESDAGRRAAIVVLPQATPTRDFDLRGGILGVLGGSGLTGGRSTGVSARAGASAGRDFLAVEAPGEDNLCKALVCRDWWTPPRFPREREKPSWSANERTCLWRSGFSPLPVRSSARAVVVHPPPVDSEASRSRRAFALWITAAAQGRISDSHAGRVLSHDAIVEPGDGMNATPSNRRSSRPRMTGAVMAVALFAALIAAVSLLFFFKDYLRTARQRTPERIAAGLRPELLKARAEVPRFDLIEDSARRLREDFPSLAQVFITKLRPDSVECCIYPWNRREQPPEGMPSVKIEQDGVVLGYLYYRLDWRRAMLFEGIVNALIPLLILAAFAMAFHVWRQARALATTPVQLVEKSRELAHLERLSLAGQLAANLLHDLKKPVLHIRAELAAG
jgi:hypothetical protein